MQKFLDIVGGFAAFLTVLLYLAIYLNSAFGPFIPADITAILLVVKEYAALAVVGITGLEFVWVKRGGLLVFIYLVIVAAVVVFMFFPGALSAIGIA